jgi:hypothetical protein
MVYEDLGGVGNWFSLNFQSGNHGIMDSMRTTKNKNYEPLDYHTVLSPLHKIMMSIRGFSRLRIT